MKKVRDGYKMTELGEIPEEWEIKKIKDIANICYGKSQKEVEVEDGKYKILGTGGVIGYTNDFLWNRPSVLIGRKGTIDKPQYIEEPFWTVDTLFYTKINENYIAKWFYYYLDNIDLKKYNEATGVPSLSVANLNTIRIATPTKKEQEKIASILSTVDEQIDNVDALIEKNKELKKGLMQTLLTKGIGHTKFKKTEIGEIPEEWEVGTLSSIIDKNRKITYGIVQPGEYVECGKYVIRAKDYSFGWVRVEEIFKCDGLVEKSYARARVKEGDVLLTIVGSVGNLAIVPSVLNEANITQQTARLSFDKNKVNNVFYYNYLKSDRAIKEINKYMKSGVQPSLNLSDVEKFKIVIPSIEEQERISLILSSVDEKVEQYENKKQKLEELKKGLMQQLLTGMIRVTV